jgi:hypothetical protein
MPARLDPQIIALAADSFPTGEGWKVLRWRDLRGTHSMQWKPWVDFHAVGGLYGVFIPERYFSQEREIDLHIRPLRGQDRTVTFAFTPKSFSIEGEDYSLVYIGRTAGLLHRLKMHFRLHQRNVGGQIKHGLLDARVCDSISQASQLVESEAVVVVYIMSGHITPLIVTFAK